MSKVIRHCIGFALLRSVIGQENSSHFLNQSDAKLKPIAIWSLAFSRDSGRLHVFNLSSHWLLVMLTFVLIGCLVLALRHSIEKRSIRMCILMSPGKLQQKAIFTYLRSYISLNQALHEQLGLQTRYKMLQ